MTVLAERRERLGAARLYLVADGGMADAALAEALAGGVDMVQLRDPELDDEALLRRAAAWRELCDDHGALLWLNDRPDLARRAGADGVHVGQGDMSVADARRVAGPELLVGLSTHAPDQLEAGIAAGADQLSVGPVWETPTKPGRPAAGLGYVRAAAARRPPQPWFAIGGIDRSNVGEVVAAGARRIVVVRAIRDAADPRGAAAELRAALERMASEGRTVGAAQ
jgi:thiamine-phosphate pyrophosphorylase